MDTDPTDTLRAFDASLDTLEATLQPLLARPLNETREGLDGIQRAKLDVLLAYAVNNLVWMYLKTRGIEPDSHGVKDELDRVKGYYTKVRDAEGGKPKTRNRIDKDAARRFITHNISTGPANPANSNAAMARRQAEAAIRERNEAESTANRSNRFRHVAKDAKRLGGSQLAGLEGSEGEDDEGEDDEEAEEGMDVDDERPESSGNSEDEAAALLAEVDAMDDGDEDMDAPPVPEPAAARVDAKSRSRSKRKRAEDMV